jgi:putative oxidoreductase
MTLSDFALLILRLGIGLTFAAHGAQKAFGWWGGPGPDRWRGAIQGMGFTPAPLFAVASIVAELVGGIALAIGLATPAAAALLIAQSVVIIFHAHWSKGFFNQGGGYEFPLSLAVGAVAIGLLGPGSMSVDGAAGIDWSATVRIGFVLVGLVAGAVGLAVPRVATRAAERRTSGNRLGRA